MTRDAVRGRPEQAKAAARWSCSGGIRVCPPAARCGNLWVPQGVWPIARRLQRHPRPQLKQTYSRKANPPGGSACCRMGTKLWLTTSISKGPFVPLRHLATGLRCSAVAEHDGQLPQLPLRRRRPSSLRTAIHAHSSRILLQFSLSALAFLDPAPVPLPSCWD